MVVEKPKSLRSYAEHRGVHLGTIQAAIKSGRLKKSVVRVNGSPKIRSFELADQEFEANTATQHRSKRAAAGKKRNPTNNKTESVAAPIDNAQADPVRQGPNKKPSDPHSRDGTDESINDEVLDGDFDVQADSSMASANRVRAIYAARRERLKYETESGGLIPADEAKHAIEQAIITSRNRLLAVPSKAKSLLPHLTLSDIAKIDDLIRDALEELASCQI